jgi:DegV family protein with EDD domain
MGEANMSILICDADGELWFTRQEELGIDYISMPYSINGEIFYYDLGKNTDLKKFYDDMRNGAAPTTMALNPAEYVDILEKYFSQGEDLLYVSFSHKMSGTFNQLQTALNELKDKYPDRKCTVFDTNAISMGAGIQMEYAAMLKNAGASDDEILQKLGVMAKPTTQEKITEKKESFLDLGEKPVQKEVATTPKKRGRPKKNPTKTTEDSIATTTPKKRGRPKKKQD